MGLQLTGRQWRTLVVLCTSNCCVYAANALLPPFYPALAEFKGATVLQYGFVFGIFRLVMGIVSPIYGSYIEIVGPRFMLTAGLFTAAGTCALMGVMNHVYGYGSFLGLSFAVQVIAALGSATLPNAITLLVNKEFPDSMGSVFALTETATGLGAMASPIIGGLLYQAYGYSAPFMAAGCVLALAAVMTFLVLPEAKANEEIITDDSTITAFDVLRQPTLAVFLMCTLLGAFTYGFVLCGLDQHLRILKLTPLHKGLVFVLGSSVYSVAVSAWGRLCDTLLRPITVTITCTAMMCIGVLFLGPAPFIPLELNLPMCVVAISVIMMSDAGQDVGSFSGLFRAADDCGLPKSAGTQGVLGGCRNAAYNLGCFLGFSCAGVFMETMGYRWSTMVVVFLQVILLIVMIICHFCTRKRSEYKPLLQEDNNNNNFKSFHSSYGTIEPVKNDSSKNLNLYVIVNV